MRKEEAAEKVGKANSSRKRGGKWSCTFGTISAWGGSNFCCCCLSFFVISYLLKYFIMPPSDYENYGKDPPLYLFPPVPAPFLWSLLQLKTEQNIGPQNK